MIQLEAFAERVRGEFGAPGFEAQGVRDFCEQPATTLPECRARALQAEKGLLALVRDFSRMRQRDQKLRQQEASLVLRREKAMREARGRAVKKR